MPCISEIFYVNGFKCRLDSMIDATKIQGLIYFNSDIRGRWLFKATANIEDIKDFMKDRVLESKKKMLVND